MDRRWTSHVARCRWRRALGSRPGSLRHGHSCLDGLHRGRSQDIEGSDKVMLEGSAHKGAASSFIEAHARVVQDCLSLIDEGTVRPTTELTILPRFKQKPKIGTGESLSKMEDVIVSAKPVAPQHRFRAMFVILLIALSALSRALVPAWSEESDIAKQAQNP